jgi:hypothetical protein
LNRKQKSKRNKALRHGQKVPDLNALSPMIAEGITYGKHALEEADEKFPPVQMPDGAEMVSHLRSADERMADKKFAPFVASNSTDAVWTDGVTDRLQMDYVTSFTEEGLRYLREGRQCLRCHEPHPDEPFPDQCDICGYAMKERQILDISIEFEGLKHIGPQKGISSYLEEQEERMERRAFEERQLNGGRSVRVKKKIYSPGARKEAFEGGSPEKGVKKRIVLPNGDYAS